MTLSYASSLDDVVEPSVRLYLRGKTSAKNRLRSALIWAVAFAALAFLGFNSKQNVNLPVICIAAALWGAGLTWLTYKGAVRRRIAKYVATELAGPWPRTTDYEIKDGKLISTTSGVTISFALADLIAVSEDAKYLELTFGSKGLCTIPLRAFADTDEKNAFRSAVGHPPLTA
jgi:hypothetical protein